MPAMLISTAAVLEAAMEQRTRSFEQGDALLAVVPFADLRTELTLSARFTLQEIGAQQQLVRVVMKEGDRFPELRDEFRERLVNAGWERARRWWSARCAHHGVPEGDTDARMVALFGSLILHPVMVTLFGQGPAGVDEDRLVEVHCFYSEKYLITVHRDDAPALAELRERYGKRRDPIQDPPLLLYKIVDGLVDSFFPILAEFDDRIDELENQIFLNANDAQLQEIFKMKRLLVGMRQVVTPQRDLFASLVGGVAELPGMSEKEERYFRDVYDHLIRISDLIDTYRDLLTGAMDVYLSTVSNRLNVVMKQLAIIATIFLPLAWLTGFFGQNFGFLVREIGSWQTFVVLGLGTELIAVVALYVMFRRRGWF